MKSLKKVFKSIKFSLHLKKLIKKEDSNAKALSYLQHFLAEEKGIFLKIIQMLETSPNVKQSVKDLLEKPSPSMTINHVKQKIKTSFGLDFNKVFDSINDRPLVASIGQVHFATLKNGSDVALKIRHPHIKEAISEQLSTLNLIGSLGKFLKMQSHFSLNDYKKELEDRMFKELNFLHEIEEQEKFKESNQNISYIKTSNIYHQYTREDIYLQDWLTGISINEIKEKWEISLRVKLAEKIFTSYIIHFFIHGHVQGDTNHQNYSFELEEESPIINFFDFGNYLTIEKNDRFYLARMIWDLIRDKAETPIPYFEKLGFDTNKLMAIEKQLPLVTQEIFAPFLLDRPFDFSSWHISTTIDKILHDDKWFLRTSGPASFFLLIRSFIGIKNLISKLGVSLNYRNLFMQNTISILPNIDRLTLPTINTSKYNFETLAKNIQITVMEKGQEKVNIKLPARSIEDLADIIDQKTKEKLINRGLDIKTIIKNVLREGCPQGEVFYLEEKEKSFQVSLI